MRGRGARAVIAFGLVDLASAISLPIAFGLLAGGCGPSSFLCLAGQEPCLFACTNPWMQFPLVMMFGALFGLLPAGGAAALLVGRRHSLYGDLAVEAVSLSAGLPAMALVGIPIVVLGLVAWPLAGALLLACNALLFRRPSPPLPP